MSRIPNDLCRYSIPKEVEHNALSWFLVAVVTNYHKLDDLEQQKSILLWLGRPEIQNQCHRTDIKV